jgi:GNAT superfamily N-acetyltransferase
MLGELGYPSTLAEVVERLRSLAASAADAVLVLTADERVLASAGLHVLPYFHNGQTICRLSSLVVRDGFRRLGLGARLLDAVEEWARGRGCQAVELTSAERRLEAHRFYERRGYGRGGIKYFKTIT